jgi:hypothetical protein
MKILSNQVKCLECGDEIYSAYRHDFKYCKCGAVGVDGGMDYLKRNYKDATSNYVDLSISIEDELYNKLQEGLTWCDDTNRNNLGRICKIFIDLRDSGYTVVKNEELLDE